MGKCAQQQHKMDFQETTKVLGSIVSVKWHYVFLQKNEISEFFKEEVFNDENENVHSKYKKYAIIKINQNNDIIIKNVFDDNEKWNQKSIYFPDDDYKYFTLKDNAGKIKEYCENQHIQKRNNNHLYSKTNHRIMFFCVEFAPFICYSHQNIQDLLQPHE